jgi:hypothetical protein
MAKDNPHFTWRWFLSWTVLSSLLIFAALKILTGMNPPQPFLIHRFMNDDLGRLVMLALIAITVVFSVYFLTFAALPGVGPHTRPAGRWLVVAVVLVLVMTALFVSGAISYENTNPFAFTWERFASLLKQARTLNLNVSHDALAAVLLLTLTLALSTAAIVSNLATSLRGCTDEQTAAIKSFLIWMHSTLTVIVAIYSVLLFKTNLRLPQFMDGFFIWYFALFYLMITVLIFLIPAILYKLLTTRATLLSFTGINLPPWISTVLSKTGIEAALPTFVASFWNMI